jgi:hypothetical protein
MVTIHTPQTTDDGMGNKMPVMPRHKLMAKTKTKTFEIGEIVECFIARMTCGRYEVMDANFYNTTEHFEVFTYEDLHNSFEEIE